MSDGGSLFRTVSAACRRLFSLGLLLLVFSVFTVEYGHLVEESVAHLRQSASSNHGQKSSSHRCHNCLTSHPQEPIATWTLDPGTAVTHFRPGPAEPVADPLSLFQLPAERAPPAPETLFFS
jgi:hypothetical protein